MTFSGTTEKCKACDKTVHFIEMVTADGVAYHKKCFKCTHCNGLLMMGNYCSMDAVLYCKPHFEQLFKETGNYTKKFQSSGEKKNGLAKAPSRLSSFFSGTQDKCSVCKKTAYPLEKVTVEGEFYHKSCFRCAHGGCFLTPSSYAALEGTVYCKHHFAQLFKEKGSYSNLNKTASIKKNMPITTEEEEKSNEQEEETNTTTTQEVEVENQAEQESAPEVIDEQGLAQEQS